MNEAPARTITVPREPIFKWLFYLAHAIVPFAAAMLLFCHFAFCVELSWQLLVIVAVALLPLLLPLICVYVGKAFGIELNDWPQSTVVPPPVSPAALAAPPAPPKGTTPQPESVASPQENAAPPAPVHLWPHPNALAPEESKVLRTLWREQRRFIAEGRKELWGFVIGPGAPDFGEFVRGFSSLAQRGLVMQGAKGIVFLTNSGLEYAKLNEEKLNMKGDAWYKFVPA